MKDGIRYHHILRAAFPFFIFFACLHGALGAAERTLTLEDSIVTGLHNNQELLALQEQISIAQERIDEANGLIYPKIDLNLSASRMDNEVPVVLAPSFNTIYLPADKKDYYYSGRISLWQYLYAGGRYSTTLRLAEINLSQARSQADASRNRIILDAKRSFYTCIATRDRIAAYENALAAIADLTAKSPSQRTSWAFYDGKLRIELLKLRHDFDRQKLQYLQALGLELNTIIDLKGDLTPPLETYDLNKCLAWAFQYRPELRQTQFQETIDSLRVHLSATERYPTVTLGANIERVGDQFPLDASNWNATININLPIFDGWASWARVRQRKYQVREGKIRRAQIEDQIRFDVRKAYSDYLFWQSQVQAVWKQPTQDLLPDKQLETALLRIETVFNALVSQSELDWAIGKTFFKQ